MSQVLPTPGGRGAGNNPPLRQNKVTRWVPKRLVVITNLRRLTWYDDTLECLVLFHEVTEIESPP